MALVPPGLLWAEEGNGYDVLEYHLEMPREYLESGRIEYASHNVYANFPANAEMLYLLAMVVHGGALAGITTAKLINVLLGFFTVAAAWLAGRESGSTAGVFTGVLAATASWLIVSNSPYLSWHTDSVPETHTFDATDGRFAAAAQIGEFAALGKQPFVTRTRSRPDGTSGLVRMPAASLPHEFDTPDVPGPARTVQCVEESCRSSSINAN